MPRIRIRKYSWQLAPGHIRDIRRRVFIEEQGVPPELEWDATDDIADHYLAVLPDNTPVGVARLFGTLEETAHIGRMAILPEHRGQGIGEALLRQLMADAAGQFQEIRLSAQAHAVLFYQKSGFHLYSDAYQDAGIPHYDMRCLAPALAVAALADGDAPLVLERDERSWTFNDEPTMLALMDSLVGQARQRLWLYDRWLQHDLYDRFRFRELISALARRHRLSEVRLLIHDDTPLVKRRHQLVELLRRLPSKMELRLTHDDYPREEQPFLLVDRQGLLCRHDFDQPSGVAGFAHGGRAKLLAESYQRMWDAARPSLELRELPL